MKISISAMRYELVCFCLPRLWVYYVGAPQVDTIRDSSRVKAFCLAFGVVHQVFSFFHVQKEIR